MLITAEYVFHKLTNVKMENIIGILDMLADKYNI